jgi:hypothetical protein
LPKGQHYFIRGRSPPIDIKVITPIKAMIKPPINNAIKAFKGQYLVLFLISRMKIIPPGMQAKERNSNIIFSFSILF